MDSRQLTVDNSKVESKKVLLATFGYFLATFGNIWLLLATFWLLLGANVRWMMYNECLGHSRLLQILKVLSNEYYGG